MFSNRILKTMMLGLLALMLAAAPAQAQMSKKQAKRLAKEAKKAIKEASKMGYKEAPGALPFGTQMNNAYKLQMEVDEEGYPKYIIGEAASVAGTKIAAKNQAMEAAKLELAGKIQSNIAALTEQSIANEQLTQEEAASITETVTAAKNIISQKLGRITILVEAYRDMGNENVESLVRIAYDKDLAHQVTLNAIRDELKKKSEDLHQKLNKLLDIEAKN